MKRNNVRLLSDAELKNVKSRFSFSLEGDYVLVHGFGNNRKTLHPIDETFALNIKRLRKVTFTVDAINIWVSLCNEKDAPNLLDVQQAVNELSITFQTINVENVKKILSGQRILLK